MMMRILSLTLTFLLAGWSFAEDVDNTVEELLTIDNGKVKVGINKAKGAAITWVSGGGYSKNLVNSYDPGRLIQQSYYAGRRLDRKKEGQHKAWSPWSWNPIQGGGVGSWARVTQFEKIGENSLHGETIPKLWDMKDEEASALMKQWTAFEPSMPNVIVVRCEFASNREENDQWGQTSRSPQEIPATYFVRSFDTFKSYLGDGKWRTESTKQGPPWSHARPPRKAMACFNAEGKGIAIFSPAGDQWNYGPHAGGKTDDPLGGPCVHIAPVTTVKLGPKSSLKYRYWLVLGTEKEIATRLDELWTKYAEEQVEVTNN